jgi:hypothetical protein
LVNSLKSIQGEISLSYYDFDLLYEWFPENKHRCENKEFTKVVTTKKGTKQNMGWRELLIMDY